MGSRADFHQQRGNEAVLPLRWRRQYDCLANTSETITDTYGYGAGGVPVASEDSGNSVTPYKWRAVHGWFEFAALGSDSNLVDGGSPYDPSLALFLTFRQILAVKKTFVKPKSRLPRSYFPGTFPPGLELLACAWCIKVRLESGFETGLGDKSAHCVGGCLIARRCGAYCPEAIGIIKEALDKLLGGTVEADDAIATDDGIACGKSLPREIKNEKAACVACCKKKGWT